MGFRIFQAKAKLTAVFIFGVWPVGTYSKTNRIIMRTFLLLGLFFLLSGCVGITWLVTDFRVARPLLDKEPGQVSDSVMLPDLNGSIRRRWVKKAYTQFSKIDVISLWGEPKDKYRKNGCEHWVYNRELAWGGGVLYVVFPIPLLIPIGNRETIIIFKDGIAIEALYEYARTPSYVCGPLMPMVAYEAGNYGWCRENQWE